MSSLVDFFKKLLPTAPTGAPEVEPKARLGRKVAVAGATGATGKFVVSSLLDAGCEVTVLASSEDRAKEVRPPEPALSQGACCKSQAS